MFCMALLSVKSRVEGLGFGRLRLKGVEEITKGS